MVMSCGLYAVTGVLGFLTFGARVDHDVLLSYPMPDVSVVVAVVFIAVKMYTSYVVTFYCARLVKYVDLYFDQIL